MAQNKKKKKTSTTEKIFNTLDNDASKIELFIEKNKENVIYVISGLVGIFLLFIGYNKYIKEPLEIEANEEIAMASIMFRQDSLDLALNGYGDNLGFLDIIEEYGSTKSGNLANYYCGIIFIKKGEFDKAIEHLSNFSSNDIIVSSIAKGLIGDAFMELEQYEDAVEYYKKASDNNPNETTTPMYLLKAGKVCMMYLNDKKSALKYFEKIKEDFPNTTESRDIDKYIARVKISN